MGAETKAKVIDGLACSSTPLPVMRALDILTECTGLMDAANNAESDAAMFGAIAKQLGGGKLRDLLPRILAGTKVKTPEGDVVLSSGELIDHAFDGHFGSLPAVFAFAVEVSFADFFEGFARVAAQLKAKAEARAKLAKPSP